MPSNKLNVRDRLEDGQLDLSMSDLDEVPVRDIALIKKATILDLSNNRLTGLGKNFATLTHILKLDLSNNHLTQLPDNFGDMTQLKHLDLYNNQITHLPLSLGELKALRWLDLKNNPLVPALADVVGQCLDAQQCQQSARKVVVFLQRMQEQVAEERLRRQQQKKKQQEQAELAAQEKKKGEHQQQKKKKKAAKTNDKAQVKQENGLKSHNAPSGEVLSTLKKESAKANSNQSTRSAARRFSVLGMLATFVRLTMYAAFFTGLSLFALSLMEKEHVAVVQGTVSKLWNQTLDYLPLPVVEKGQQLVDAVRPLATEVAQHVHNFTLQVYLRAETLYIWLKTDETVQEYMVSLRRAWDTLCIGVGDTYRTLSHHTLLYVETVKKKLL